MTPVQWTVDGAVASGTLPGTITLDSTVGISAGMIIRFEAATT